MYSLLYVFADKTDADDLKWFTSSKDIADYSPDPDAVNESDIMFYI